jgi:CubicO group peptidase (beta-lactamase class C family)
MNSNAARCLSVFFLSTFCNPFSQALADTCAKLETNLRSEFAIQGQALPRFTLDDHLKKYRLPGVSIAVLDHGKITCAKGYGVKELGQPEPITPDTLFLAGSVSKPMAALGALYLVDQGLIQLDEDVNHYLKSWKIPENEFTTKEKVTLRRLLSHSAGLTIHGFPGYERGSSIPSLIDILKGTKPLVNTDAVVVDTIPGTKWRYSGGGYTVVQLLIQDVTGEAFGPWMKKTILDPLGMKDSTFENPLPSLLHSRAATGYGQGGKEVKGKWHVYPENAAAGLWTTPSDLLKAILYIQQAHQDDKKRVKLLSTKIIREMLTVQKDKSGLGPLLRPSPGFLTFSHGGVDEGFLTSWTGVIQKDQPQNYRGFVIMLNSLASEGPLMGEIEASISDTYSWKNQSVQWRTLSKDASKIDFQPFIGKYKPEKGHLVIQIFEKDHHLYFQDNFMPAPMELLPQGENHFFALAGADIRFGFKDKKVAEIGVKFPNQSKEDVFPKSE